jgi:hypothetical protein
MTHRDERKNDKPNTDNNSDEWDDDPKPIAPRAASPDLGLNRMLHFHSGRSLLEPNDAITLNDEWASVESEQIESNEVHNPNTK